MHYKLKKILTNWKVIVLIIFLLFAVIAIHPAPGARGLIIKSVIKNSSAELAGIEPPKPSTSPLSRERLIAVNNVQVNSLEDYNSLIKDIQPGQKISLQTNKAAYSIKVKPLTKTTVFNETELKAVNETIQSEEMLNGSIILINKTVEKLVEVPKTETIVLGAEDIGLRLAITPGTNIRKGLDLQGGTRVVLQPEEEVSKETMDLLLANMGQRLNVFGLSDVVLRSAGDLSGGQFIVVEIAGANEEEVKELLSKQGKFESKIQNASVFKGGSDITYVCRSAECSGIDPTSGCGSLSDGRWTCRFRFSISLSPEAAKRQAAATSKLDVLTVDETGNPISKENQYLSDKIYLFLDDQLVDSLNIGAELKGRDVTEISITGSGIGQTENLAALNALENMKRLQTILITGSLPIKMKIVKSDSISPLLGPEFINNALLISFTSIIAVSLLILLRYRKLVIVIPVITVILSEMIILLGFAAIVGWNIDLASIAGIIIVIGTSVDDQIIIADEAIRKESSGFQNWKAKLKNAFFIIFGAYFTMLFAMVPLLFAGAGLLKGFALTTIVGISIGVLITRPAFAAMLEVLFQE